MDYISTRGEAPSATFLETLFEGVAPDGGLRMPAEYPPLDFESLQGCHYVDVAKFVLSRFAPDILFDDLADIIEKTYTKETFGSTQIVPTLWIEPGLGLLRTSNGPTLSFKDIALQLLGNLLEYGLKKRGGELNVLGATSGDTGSAAEYALACKSKIRCFMLSPYGRMSPFQQAQMYTLDYPDIHNLVVDDGAGGLGDFDTCQRLVKEVNADADFKKKYSLGAVNSINWARIAAQVVYWVYAYLRAPKNSNRRVMFSVQCGNFGNFFAAYTARRMGLPVDLVVATNENYVLHEFFGMSLGQYRVRKGSEVKVTTSPSMDIASASNFERYIFEVVERNGARVRELWAQLGSTGTFTLKEAELECVAYSDIDSGMATEVEVLEAIRLIEKCGVIIEPHTAVAMKVGLDYRKPGVPLIVAETAKPAKFADTIKHAIGRAPPMPPNYEEMLKLPHHVQRIPPDARVLKRYIEQNVR